MTLGKRLRVERLKRQWTLEDMKNKLGLKGHSTYSNYEYDKREPDNETLVKLANLFDVSLDYLLGKKEDNNPSTFEIAQSFYESLTDEKKKEFELMLKTLMNGMSK